MPAVIGQDNTASGFDPGLANPPITFGVWGDSGNGTGIVGSSRPASAAAPARPDGAGVFGINNAQGGLGVWCHADHQLGIGVLGTSAEDIGVGGESDGSGTGVTGKSAQGTGVSGTGRDGTAITGVSHDFVGISGRSGHSDSGGFGHGFAANQAPGVFGATFNGDGVYGFSLNGGSSRRGGTTGITARGATLAGDFEGNVRVSGMLTKGGGGFKIDHPLDQESRYLAHSFVESSEMKNFYDGGALLDANGEATIELPYWFEALNETFRYQITPIGAPASRGGRQDTRGKGILPAPAGAWAICRARRVFDSSPDPTATVAGR